jgi:hypothetical protein
MNREALPVPAFTRETPGASQLASQSLADCHADLAFVRPSR